MSKVETAIFLQLKPINFLFFLLVMDALGNSVNLQYLRSFYHNYEFGMSSSKIAYE